MSDAATGAVPHREIVLQAAPHGMVKPSAFALRAGELPPLQGDEVRVETLCWACDPGLRHRLASADPHTPALVPGSRVTGFAVGQVVAAPGGTLRPGDIVTGSWGWTDLANVRATTVAPAPPFTGHPPYALLSYLGVPGATAYFGLLEVGRLKAGQQVFITSAAGAVGALACQIAHLHGARVVGVAGGPQKAEWLRSIGVDQVIDHRSASDLSQALGEAFPDGIDLVFDTLGNELIEAALPHMALRGRLVLCGNTADANVPLPRRHGVRNTRALIARRLSMEGFYAPDYAQRFPEAWAYLRQLKEAGRLRVLHDLHMGMEVLPTLFCSLFSGPSSMGRKIVMAHPVANGPKDGKRQS